MLFLLLAHRRSINFPLDLLTDNKVFVSLAHIVRWMPLLCRDMVEGAAHRVANAQVDRGSPFRSRGSDPS